MITCKVRKIAVAATPEEKVRQLILNLMIEDLGYPEGGFAVEVALNSLPLGNWVKNQIPNRRADIIFFLRRGPELLPLLLIECKAVKLTKAVINQAIGYNYFLRAGVIVLANQMEIKTGFFSKEGSGCQFMDGLPSFQELGSLLGI